MINLNTLIPTRHKGKLHMENKNISLFIITIFMAVFIITFTSAQSLKICFSPEDATGNIITDTNFNYSLIFTNISDCSGVIFSDNFTLHIGPKGLNCSERILPNVNLSDVKYICEYRAIYGSALTLRMVHNLSTQLFDNIYANNANFTGNVTADWFKGKLNYSDVQNVPIITGGDNSSFNQTLTNSLYTNFSSFNATQITYSNGYINILESWLNSFGWIKTWLLPNTANGYLYNDSSSFYLNETKLNNTIDNRTINIIGNSTIVRSGNATGLCASGTTLMNMTIVNNASGSFLTRYECVSSGSGLSNYNNITMLNVTNQNMTFYNLTITNGFWIVNGVSQRNVYNKTEVDYNLSLKVGYNLACFPNGTNCNVSDNSTIPRTNKINNFTTNQSFGGNTLINVSKICNESGQCFTPSQLNNTGTSGTDTWALNYTLYSNKTFTCYPNGTNCNVSNNITIVRNFANATCTGTNVLMNVTINNGRLAGQCVAQSGGSTFLTNQDNNNLNKTANVSFGNLNVTNFSIGAGAYMSSVSTPVGNGFYFGNRQARSWTVFDTGANGQFGDVQFIQKGKYSTGNYDEFRFGYDQGNNVHTFLWAGHGTVAGIPAVLEAIPGQATGGETLNQIMLFTNKHVGFSATTDVNYTVHISGTGGNILVDHEAVFGNMANCQGTPSVSDCTTYLVQPSCENNSYHGGCSWTVTTCSDNPSIDCSIYSQGECTARTFCNATYVPTCVDAPSLNCAGMDEGTCNSNLAGCQNNGYVDPNNCYCGDDPPTFTCPCGGMWAGCSNTGSCASFDYVGCPTTYGCTQTMPYTGCTNLVGTCNSITPLTDCNNYNGCLATSGCIGSASCNPLASLSGCNNETGCNWTTYVPNEVLTNPGTLENASREFDGKNVINKLPNEDGMFMFKYKNGSYAPLLGSAFIVASEVNGDPDALEKIPNYQDLIYPNGSINHAGFGKCARNYSIKDENQPYSKMVIEGNTTKEITDYRYITIQGEDSSCVLALILQSLSRINQVMDIKGNDTTSFNSTLVAESYLVNSPKSKLSPTDKKKEEDNLTSAYKNNKLRDANGILDALPSTAKTNNTLGHYDIAGLSDWTYEETLKLRQENIDLKSCIINGQSLKEIQDCVKLI